MRADQSALHDLLKKALALAEQTFARAPAAEQVLVDGEESFLDAPEFTDVRKARALLRAFAEKDRILRVLDRVLPPRRCRSSSARRASSPRFPTCRWWRRRTAAAGRCSARWPWSARPG